MKVYQFHGPSPTGAVTPALLSRQNVRLSPSSPHREALAALKLFQEAAEREAATADLARRVLRFLFRARHDQGLRFES